MLDFRLSQRSIRRVSSYGTWQSVCQKNIVENYCIHLQGRKGSQVSNQQEASSNRYTDSKYGYKKFISHHSFLYWILRQSSAFNHCWVFLMFTYHFRIILWVRDNLLWIDIYYHSNSIIISSWITRNPVFKHPVALLYLKLFMYYTVRQQYNKLFLPSYTFTFDTTYFSPKWPTSGILLC
jgi:hypothetical protein